MPNSLFDNSPDHQPWDLKTLIGNYNKGFKGSIYDPVHYNKFMSELPMPLFGAAATDIKDSGKGKLSLPFKSVLFFDKGSYTERQTTGDCFSVHSPVLMGNGQHKKISEIKIGEEVITHKNKRRKVLNTIKKPYSGKIKKITTSNQIHTPIECTPDHKFISLTENGILRWKKAEELLEGDRLLAPYGIDKDFIKIPTFDLYEWTKDDPKVQDLGNGRIRYRKSRYTTKRYVELDEDLAWVIGMYLAEGGTDTTDAYRIEWSLERHVEQEYADRICRIMEEKFGGRCYQNNLPSKPTVTMVRYGNKLVGKFLKKLIPGNVYDKILPAELLYTPKNIRIAILRGWLDGDGHLGFKENLKTGLFSFSLGGATASIQMRDTLSILARSVGIKNTKLTRPMQPHQTSDSFELHIARPSIFDIYPEKEELVRDKLNVACLDDDEFNHLGQIVEVKKIEETEIIDDFVYCLEVEEEHTFIVNSIAVSNCVSMGTRNAVDITRAVQIHVGHSAEGWVTRGATEAIYGSRHHGGQGMACSQAAEFVHKTGGIILRQKYPSADLTVYNSSIGSRWGTAGVPHDIIEAGKQHQIRTVSLVRTIDEVRDALANGYGVACCSNQGFSSVRDKNGYSRPQGSWSHCLCICGCDDTHSVYNETTFCLVNSWGPNWISGPKPEFGIPDGAFMVRAETIARMVGGGGSFAYSQAIGFPPVKLPDYSNKSFL